MSRSKVQSYMYRRQEKKTLTFLERRLKIKSLFHSHTVEQAAGEQLCCGHHL